MLRAICEKLGFDSLGYQSLDGLLEAIGIDREILHLLLDGEGVKTLRGGRFPPDTPRAAPGGTAGLIPPHPRTAQVVARRWRSKQRRTPAN